MVQEIGQVLSLDLLSLAFQPRALQEKPLGLEESGFGPNQMMLVPIGPPGPKSLRELKHPTRAIGCHGWPQLREQKTERTEEAQWRREKGALRAPGVQLGERNKECISWGL